MMEPNCTLEGTLEGEVKSIADLLCRNVRIHQLLYLHVIHFPNDLTQTRHLRKSAVRESVPSGSRGALSKLEPRLTLITDSRQSY